MFKDEKNVITIEKIKQRLLSDAKGDCLFNVMKFIIATVVSVPLGIAVIYLFWYLKLLYIGIIASLIFFVPSVIVGRRLVKSIISYARLAKYGVEVIESEVTLKVKQDTPKKGKKYNIDALYFGKYGRFAVSAVDFQISSEGDKFYLVIPKWEEDTYILSAYSQKTYEIV